MKKFEIPLLTLIAVCAVFLGMKFSASLHVDVSNVEIKELTNFDDFDTRLETFVASGEIAIEGDKDIIFSEQKNLYLRAQQWEWYPDLEIQSGREYLLHVATSDIQHALHLETKATGRKIDILIQPGKEYLIKLNNLKPGAYAIGCTQYCGIEHNKMRGKLIVR